MLATARRVRPDLIVLDVMLPGRSGLSILEELRRDDELGETPVIMLTARAQARDARAAGGRREPLPVEAVQPSELAATVETLLSREGGEWAKEEADRGAREADGA